MRGFYRQGKDGKHCDSSGWRVLLGEERWFGGYGTDDYYHFTDCYSSARVVRREMGA